MEPPAQISCSGNCLVHLLSAAGEAWLQRHARPSQQRVGPDGISYYLVSIENYQPAFLSAHEIHKFYLQSSIASIERLYGIRVQNVLAIIPASMNPRPYLSKLSAVADSVGVRIVHYVQRPFLAASYYSSLSTTGRRTILVFELGGQFLEISLLNDQNQVLNIMAAVSDLGCPLFNRIVSELTRSFGVDFTGNANFLQHIRTECERAKDALCLGPGTAEVKIQVLNMEVMRTSIDREWLVQMNLNHLRSGIMRCLTEAGVRQEAVNEVVLAGASCNIPEVRSVLLEFFQRQAFRCSIDPANLIQLSSMQYKSIISQILNVPVACFQGFNLGIYFL